MATLNKQRVAIAQNSSSRLDVSCTHVTSGDFMHVSPVYYRHMLPKEHIKGHVQVNCRLAPMVVPTYGRARINVRNFFVPFRIVFPNFNEFLADSIASNYSASSLVSSSPTVSNAVLYEVLTSGYVGDYPISQNIGVYTDYTDDNRPAFDFVDDGGNMFVLNRIGREMYRRLLSLGYRVNFNKQDRTFYSALPILCLAKVLLDWYTNSNYMDNVEVLEVERLLKFNDPSSNLVLDNSGVISLLHFIEFVCYDGNMDYITNAWDNPTAPNAGLFSPLTARDVTSSSPNDSAIVNTDSNGTPFMQLANNNVGSQYIHDILKSFTDYTKRHQLSGARAADRLLAEYGVNLDSSKVNRSIFISTHSQDIQIGDVTSMANTSNTEVSNLGDFAGRGFSQGGLDFDFVADEFGIFISLLSIIPQAGLYQGFDRNNLHISKLDFFTNELDSLGVQAISKREAFVPMDGRFASGNDYDGVFGFAPRYAEYKIGRAACVSGDFVLGSRIADGDAWHLFRKLDTSFFEGSPANLVHSLNFTRGLDAPNFNRIFSDTSSSVDKFYLVVATQATSIAPCKSLFDTYVFDDAKKSVLIHSNGVKAN